MSTALQALQRELRRLAIFATGGRRLRARLRVLRDSGLFDADYYLQRYPEVALYAGGPLAHYVLHGSREGRSPSALFDEPAYRARYSEVQQEDNVGLLHYLEHDDNNPNRWFDGKWYKLTYPDVADSGMTPLQHYLMVGARESRDPSPRFCTAFYRRMNPQAAQAGANPLAHFIQHGHAQGREPLPPHRRGATGRPVDESEIHCVKQAPHEREAALFVAHAPDGRLKPHVMHYLRALRASGIATTLLVAADRPFRAPPDLIASVRGLYVRRNEGLDFAAWAHVMRLDRQYYDADILYLLNDSVIGPLAQADLDHAIQRIRESPAQVVGMTENQERGWHLQSYFLALKGPVLRSLAFQRFMRSIEVLDEKADVIDQYEIRLAPMLRQAGWACEALFTSPGDSNPTIHRWRELIEQGFPFVKVTALRTSLEEKANAGAWQDALSARGFDASLAAQTLACAGQPVHADRATPLMQGPDARVGPPKLAFISPFNFDNGLGAAGRSYISALRRTGLQLGLHPIHLPFHVHRQLCPAREIRDFVGPADVVLIHLNPEGWEAVLTPPQRQMIEAASYRIGLWVWETEVVPRRWLPAIERVDAIWVPSLYCAKAMRALTDKPIHIVPHGVVTRHADSLGNAPQGRLEEKVILYIFDGSSYLARKNPHALVRAFARSGLASRGWRLILKTKHLDGQAELAHALRSLVSASDAVSLIERTMSRDELAQLFDAAAIYASPHSSEGFGLTIAEAMARGKLVVATNYGGSVDFLDEFCGFPVKYSMHTLPQTEGAYEKGSTWAQVNEEDLALRLAQAAGAIEQGSTSLGARAIARVAERLSADAVCSTILAALQGTPAHAHSHLERLETPDDQRSGALI